MRPDGRVVAMVGGKSYKDSPFNRATQARRQPGSAFKLFVYLAALRAGWTPDSMIEDRPITIDGWTPANNDGVYRGEITLREAFARSSNAATVRLSESVGRANVIRAARELGITTPLAEQPSVALGTAGVSLLELTSAYAAVASGRYPIRARGLPETEAAGRFGGLLQSRRPDGFAPRLGADARPALRRRQQRHGPARRAGRADVRQDRNQPGQSRRLVRRLRGKSRGRRLGRPRRRQAAWPERQRRHGAGADLAQFHGLGPGRRRPSRAAAAGEFRIPEQVKPRKERESPLPEEWSEGAEPFARSSRDREAVRMIWK